MLYPHGEHLTPAQKLFRREPAITEFGKLFTPYHKSSTDVTRSYGSGLHLSFEKLHPAHGKLIPFRVLRTRLTRYSHSVSLRLQALALSHAVCVNSPAHSSIGTPSRNHSSSTLCRCMVSELFHRPSGLLFTFPSRYWFTIDLYTYLALGVSSPGFIQAIRVSDYSRSMTKESISFQRRGYYPLGLCFPADSSIRYFCNSSSNKWNVIAVQPSGVAAEVWAPPRSLAATKGMLRRT